MPIQHPPQTSKKLPCITARQHGTKIRKKLDNSVMLQHFLITPESLTVVSNLYSIDIQLLTKKLQKHVIEKILTFAAF